MATGNRPRSNLSIFGRFTQFPKSQINLPVNHPTRLMPLLYENFNICFLHLLFQPLLYRLSA